MGFVPNSIKIMARNPELLNGFLMLSNAVLGPSSKLDPDLRQMIAHMSNAAAGCQYCQAHTAHGAERMGSTRPRSKHFGHSKPVICSAM